MDKCIKKDKLWMALSPVNKEKSSKVGRYLDLHLKSFVKTEKYQRILKKYDISFPEIN